MIFFIRTLMRYRNQLNNWHITRCIFTAGVLLLNYGNFIFMSTLHHEDLLLTIFEEVQEAFPYLDEEKQIEIANNRFQELCI